ncbi:MAG: acyl-CoA synthetase [Myxococcales bacterium]
MEILTIVDAMVRTAARHPDRGFIFLDDKGVETAYTFPQILAEAQRRGRALSKRGLRKGDRMALVVPDPEDFILTFFGALCAGVIPVPLYPPLALGKLDAYIDASVKIMTAAGARILLTTGKVQPVLWSCMGKVPGLEDILVVDKAFAGDPGSSELPDVAAEDIAFLQFTSGSTSDPKGVIVTHRNLVANTTDIWAGIEIGNPEDMVVSWLPLYHDMGLIGKVLTPLVSGTRAVFIPTLSFLKKPTVWMDVMTKYEATVTFAPNFAYSLATRRAKPEHLARWDLSRMRVFGCGAEPIKPETMSEFTETFAAAGLKPEAMLPCYGMAEATLAISFVPLRAKVETDLIDADTYHEKGWAVEVPRGTPNTMELVSCGSVFPGHEIGVMDEAGRLLPERRVGELCLRGPSVTPGYWRNPEATARTIVDGWLHTGDLGYVAGGRVFVSGRKKDILILNGRNYYPQSVEWLIEELPGVRKGNVVVFSRPGASSEELVVAAETRAAGSEDLKAEIRRIVSDELSLRVADIVFLSAGQLPKTSSGKVQRAKTRDQYIRGTLGREGVRTMGSSDRIVIARHLAVSFLRRAGHRARRLVPTVINRFFQPSP